MLTVDPTQISFNWRNARALAEACARVYLEPSPLPGEIWLYARNTDAHALIQDRGDCLVVAFRGSKDAEDYIQDGKFAFTDLVYTAGAPGWELPARVHDGFLEDFDSLDEDLVHAVNGALTGRLKTPIFITGHSLGGALAILCALEFARLKYNIAGIYTFGGPRVGNSAFEKIYDTTDSTDATQGTLGVITYRIVNENDIVPRVPPWINGYRHVGQNIFLPVGTKTGWVRNPSRWYIALSDALGLWGAFSDLHDVLIMDHHIEAYQERMQLL